MATHTQTKSAHGNGSGTVVEYDRFIEMQLRKTRSQVRNVDIAGELMVLSAGTLAYFLAVALIDHWIIPGGLGQAARFLFLGVFVAGAGYYFLKYVAPLLLHRINPVYAAHAIESSKPSLKNSLVNFLLFRQHREELSDVVYQAIEEQAATNLAKVPLESAVDRSKLIRIGYVLLGVLLACALYKVASPKDPLRTVGRVVMPWADIQPPTRVSILEIEPGDTTEFTGQKVTVSAEVRGVRDSDTIRVLYATADGQTVDQAVEMRKSADGYRLSAILPADDAVLEQDLKYRIEAGDAVSKEYRVTVVAAPTIVVESVEYSYPKYTGLLPRRVEHQGDIKAIEGTEVTVRALANQDIRSAGIDFDCDDKTDVAMSATGRNATAKFLLGMKKDRTPEHTSYQVLYKNADGRSGVRPLHYQIETTPDLPPLVEFLAPAKDDVEIPADGAVSLQIEAKDPDFALQRVRLVIRRDGKPLADPLFLDKEWRGKFQRRFQFEPRKLGLKSGDKVEYWAVAEDNKTPQPNRTETAKRRITIVSPTQEKPQPDQLAQANEKQPPEKDPADQNRDRADNDNRRPQDRDEQKSSPENGDQKSDSSDSKDGNAGERGKSGDKNDKSDPSQQKNGDSGGDQSGESQDKPGANNSQGQGQQGDQPGDRKDGEGKAGESGDDKNSGPGENNGQGQQNQPVPKDGSDDAGAFDRVLKQLDKDQANQPQDKGGQQPKQNQGGKNDQSGEPGQKGDSSNDPQQNGGQDARGDDAGGDDGGGSQSGSGGGGKSGGKGGQQGSGDQRGAGQNSNNAGQKGPRGAGGQPSGQANQNDPANSGDDAGDKDSSGSNSDDKKSADKNSRDSGAGDRGQGDSEPGKNGDDKNASGAPGQKQDGGGKPTNNGKNNSPQDGQRAPDTQRPRDAGGDRAPDQPLVHDKNDRAGGKGGDKTSDRDADAPKFKPDGSKPGQPAGKKPPEDSRAPSAGEGQDKPGRGDDAQGNAGSSKKPSREKKPNDTGGDAKQDKGDPGAGQAGKDDAKSPSPQDINQPRKKNAPHDDAPNKKQDDESQSPSTAKKQSDTDGEEGGDQSGGAKPGGGQRANKPGTGGSGKNTAADEGAGHSEEAGDGDSTNQPGGNQKSDHPTGKPGSEKGEGSTSQAGSSREGGQSSEKGNSNGQSVDNTRRQQGKLGSNGNGPDGQGGGGAPGDQKGEPQPPPPADDKKADEANLEFARKATDLALERLKHQLDKNQVDQKLLDSLGWTRDDLEQFVRRWEAMRREARQGGAKGQVAKKELDEALRSLGLRPHGTTLKADSNRDDQVHGLRESLRTQPPSEYAEPYKRYIQGTARGGN